LRRVQPQGGWSGFGRLTMMFETLAHRGRLALVIDGRRRLAGSAIFSESGLAVAMGRALWIEVPESAFLGPPEGARRWPACKREGRVAVRREGSGI
jgi:hypothetical protein